MTSFDEIMTKIQKIHELILSKLQCGEVNREDQIDFSKHLVEIKSWFIRISWINKKRFLFDLIYEIDNLWTIANLLRCTWNSKAKDAVISMNEIWSSYDQVPMGHNRTLFLSSLEELMQKDREWFRSLKNEKQCKVIAELLMISGGPLILEVHKNLEKIYYKHKEWELKNLSDCLVVTEPLPEKKAAMVINGPSHRKSSATQVLEASKLPLDSAQAQKELELNLAKWTSTMKSIKDNLKIEKFEMTYKDGTEKKIFIVNRTKPDSYETVDFIQLLPSEISKRILMLLPTQQLNDCARVNKYWVYLIEEYRSELVARQKIDVELERLRVNMLFHDVNLGLLNKYDNGTHFNTKVNTIKSTKNSNLLDKEYAFNKRLAKLFANRPRVSKVTSFIQ